MIGITGLGYKSPGCCVARAIKAALPNAKLAGIGVESDIGIYSNLFSERFFVFTLDVENLIFRCAKKIVGIIPARDEEVEAYSEVAELFESAGIRVILPDFRSVRIVNDKLEFYRFLLRKGFSTARTSDSPDSLNFPIFVKGRRKGVYLARDESEVEAGIAHVRSIGEKPVFQEFVNGEVYSVAGFVYGDVSAFLCVRKLLVDIDGTTLMGITVENEELIRVAEGLASKLRWEGPFEVEFVVSDVPMIIEMNPRHPFWICACAKINPNIPLVHYRCLLDEKVEIKRSNAGKIFFLEYSFSVLDVFDLLQHQKRKI